ncbi:MAG: ABC transporter ATP-binding protein, partial [Clostridia bacterium]|nr:ABC transporter ATP-binding protein [Clostridia bacterium]
QTEAMTMGSRIVIMKDGFIQQVDTPQNNYDYPANKFVAGFIGSPQMNFFDVTLKAEGGKIYALFGDNKILVPQEKIRLFKDESYIGKEVVMGIRPENIDDAPEFVAAHADAKIKVHVEVTELMGSETYLYFSTSGKEENVIARVDPRTSTRAGDDIEVAFDTSRLHFFDKETEETIMNRG